MRHEICNKIKKLKKEASGIAKLSIINHMMRFWEGYPKENHCHSEAIERKIP